MSGLQLPAAPAILGPEVIHEYVQNFNRNDHTHFGQAISNEAAADWMAANVPLFDCPDEDMKEIYHFRWWTFRKHIKETPDGFVITEFLPKVSWSGKHNTISCPAGHHFREGRWIRDPKYLDDYAVFWFRKGPSWPFATSVTLTALANVLNDYTREFVTKNDYFETLKIYTKSHRMKRDDGKVVPWIDENLNPDTGDWIARTRLKSWKDGTWDPGKGGVERGKDYNHSSYCDLIITGLVGLRPRDDDTVLVNPLLPDGNWDYFCLDGVPYHGRMLTILYDKTGQRYGKGGGSRVLADGKEIGFRETLGRLEIHLPAK
jgi:hypothetical protein